MSLYFLSKSVDYSQEFDKLCEFLKIFLKYKNFLEWRRKVKKK